MLVRKDSNLVKEANLSDVPGAAILGKLESPNLDDACEVYHLRYSSVFETSAPPLGQVALKEVLRLALKQRFRRCQDGRSKADQDVRHAEAFFEEGLRTPDTHAMREARKCFRKVKFLIAL